jgi:hypothetical protein
MGVLLLVRVPRRVCRVVSWQILPLLSTMGTAYRDLCQVGIARVGNHNQRQSSRVLIVFSTAVQLSARPGHPEPAASPAILHGMGACGGPGVMTLASLCCVLSPGSLTGATGLDWWCGVAGAALRGEGALRDGRLPQGQAGTPAHAAGASFLNSPIGHYCRCRFQGVSGGRDEGGGVWGGGQVQPHRTAGLELLSTALWHLKQEVDLCFLAQTVGDEFQENPLGVEGDSVRL